MAQQQHIPIEHLKPHFSTKLWRSYYHYVVTYFSESLFDQILEELKMPKDYVLKDGNWVSNEFSKRFMQLLIQKTMDPNIAENVGRFNLRPENINYLEYSLIKLMPPYIFFRLFPVSFKKVNLLNKLQITRSGIGFFEFELSKSDGLNDDSSVCDGLYGTFDGVKNVLGLDRIDVTHPNCVHKGGTKCNFLIKYKARRFYLKAFFNTLIFLACPSLVFVLAKAWAKTSLVSFAPYLLTLLSFTSIVGLFFLSKVVNILRFSHVGAELDRQKNQVIFESHSKLDRRYREQNLLRDLSLQLVKINDPNKIIQFSINTMMNKFSYKKVIVMLLNTEGNSLDTWECRGLGKLTTTVANLKLVYPDPRPKQMILTKILENGRSLLIDDIQKFQKELTEENRQLIESLNVTSLIASPIQSEDDKYGLIIVGSTHNETSLTTDDKFLIENITRLLSLFFINAKQFEKEKSLRALFQKFVPSFIQTQFKSSESESLYRPVIRPITSLFTDLRGFTKFSEKNSPEKVVKVLEIYFDYITKIIDKNGGIIDNLIGDGVVAYFTDQDHHRRNALNSGKAMVDQFEELRDLFKQNGVEDLGLGIGMHSGTAIVGPIGCNRKLNFTAVGDTVNTASRLESYTKEYFQNQLESQTAIMIASSETLGEEKLHFQETIEVAGRQEPLLVSVYFENKPKHDSK